MNDLRIPFSPHAMWQFLYRLIQPNRLPSCIKLISHNNLVKLDVSFKTSVVFFGLVFENVTANDRKLFPRVVCI